MFKALILAAALLAAPAYAKPNVVEATPATFVKEVSTGTVIVDFYTTWCGWCKVEEAILIQIANEHPDVKIVRFNAEKFPKPNINTYPTLVIVVNGKVIQKIEGAAPKDDLLKLLKPYLLQGT